MPAPTFPNPDRRTIRSRRSAPGRVVDVAARIGSVVTLAALLLVTGMLLTMLDAQPVPTGAATAAR